MAKSVAYTSLSTGNLRPAGCFAPSFSAVSSWWGSLGSGAKVGVLLCAASAVVGTGLGVGLRNRNRPAAAAAADFCGYSGYRLLELFRFRALARERDEAIKKGTAHPDGGAGAP